MGSASDAAHSERGQRAFNKSPRAAFGETIMGHPIFRKVLERGAKVAFMPRLEPAADLEALALLFEAAEAGTAGRTGKPLGVWQRQQVALWRRRMEEIFAPVADLLP